MKIIILNTFLLKQFLRGVFWLVFQIVTGKPLAENGLTLQSLRNNGYKAVFIGIGQFI